MIETSTLKVSAYGNDHITISGISTEDRERVEGCLKSGAYWLRVCDGKLEIVPSWEQLPDPVQDEEMLPFWRKQTKSEVRQNQPRLFEIERLYEHSSPSISIQHLCGYGYSPERYKTYATKLESYGFECMRSRRGLDGKYWEIWFLPGLWSAKGELKNVIDSPPSKKEALQVALDFLARNISFGTLDVSVQRLAAVLESE